MDQRMTALKWLGWEQYELPAEAAGQVSEADNLAYAKALMSCAAGDGEISPAEREWIVGYLTTAGDPEAVVDAMADYDGGDEIGDLLGLSPILGLTGRALIYDALRACASDGELSPGELDRIGSTADGLGISRDVVAELEQIVDEEKALRKRRHQIILADMLAGAGG